MNASAISHQEIIQRLKTYYPECELTQLPNELVIRHPMGHIQVRGSHVSFFALGESLGDLDFETEDEQYKGIESFLLTLNHEQEKCNPTFIKSLKNAEKRSRRALIAGCGIMMLSIFGYYLCELPALLLIAIVFPILSTASLRFVRKHSFRQDWVCPHCGTPLPLDSKEWIPKMTCTARCPACGKNLLSQEQIENLRKELSTPQPSGEESPSDAESSPSAKPFTDTRSTAGKQPPSKKVGVLACKGFGISLLLFVLIFGALMFVDIDLVPIPITAINVTALLLTAAAAAVLLSKDSPALERTVLPIITVRERRWISWLGIFIGVFGMLMLFCSFLFSSPPFSLGYVILFSVIGLANIWLGCAMLLARKNRSLLIDRTQIVYTTTFGNTKNYALAQIASVRIRGNGSISFFSSEKKKLFSIERNMSGVSEVIDWIVDQQLDINVPKSVEAQMEENSRQPVSWSSEYRTALHDHLPAIRIGLILVTILLILGSVVPFALYLVSVLKTKPAIYLTAFSTLPIILYYIAFAPVFLTGKTPAGASEEWKAMHIKFPSMLTLLCGLLITGQFEYFWSKYTLIIADIWPYLLLWAGLSAVLIIAFWKRTPKRMRKHDEFILLLLGLALISYSLSYGFTLAVSGPPKHYPAEIVERHEPIEGKKDDDFSLTVLLDDGSTVSIDVSEQVYHLQEYGVDFVVCQKDNFMGIRMVRLHLPEGTDLSSLLTADHSVP